jgi:hypothetical protein
MIAPGMAAMRRLSAKRTPGAPKLAAPKWLTTRMAILLVVAFGALATVPVMWNPPA